MTPYYEREEWPGFLAAIRFAPDDDLPRLVAADFVEECGDAKRAEFIRVQVELKRICKPVFRKITGEDPSTIPDPLVQRHAKLKTREHELFDWFCREDMAAYFGLPNHDGIHPTLHGIVCPSRRCDFNFDRGFVSCASGPLVSLHGGECSQCGGDGGSWSRSIDQSGSQMRLICLHCHGTGRISGVFGQLLKREPVAASGIVVTDREPHPNSYGGTVCGWQAEADDPVMASAPSHVPYSLLKVMTELDGDDMDGRTWLTFPTADAARLALGQALYRLHATKLHEVMG